MVFRREQNDPDADDAARRGIEAAQRVQDAQDVPVDWEIGGLAEQMIENIVATQYEFTTDDIWAVLEPEIAAGRLQEPNERRILGAFIRRLESNGIIEKTEFDKRSTRRNAAPIRVWRASPGHVFSKWREWGAMRGIDPRVQDAKDGLDASIQANEERIIRAQEDIQMLQEMLERDRNNSESLSKRGYDRKLPGSKAEWDDLMINADMAQKRLEKEWIESTAIKSMSPWGVKPATPEQVLTALMPYIELDVYDKDTEEKIGEMRLASKSEDDSIGLSAQNGIIGYQEVGIKGEDPERIRKVVENWFGNENTVFVGSPNGFTGNYEGIYDLQFFPRSIVDNMRENEKMDVRAIDNIIEGPGWNDPFTDYFGNDGMNILDGDLTFEEALSSNRYESQRFEKYIQEFPGGFINTPAKWLAYNDAAREAIWKLERDARKGVPAAINALKQMDDQMISNMADFNARVEMGDWKWPDNVMADWDLLESLTDFVAHNRPRQEAVIQAGDWGDFSEKKYNSAKGKRINIGDWGGKKNYVPAMNVRIGEIGKRKTYVRPTTFRHRTYSNGRDDHILYVADVRNTKRTQEQAQRQAQTARKNYGYKVRTVKTADGWLNYFRQPYPTYERGFELKPGVKGGVYMSDGKQLIDLSRMPYQRRFGLFHLNPKGVRNSQGMITYDRKKR